MSKETFKNFARIHPELAKTVQQGTTTWQKLYELYDIYGENNSVWDDYITKSTSQQTTTSFKELFNAFRNLDIDSVQKGVTNLQKTIGLLQDIGITSTKDVRKNTYEPRPLYKYFED